MRGPIANTSSASPVPVASHVLVTGGSGFFGAILMRRLLREGNTVVNFDLEQGHYQHPALTNIIGDIRNAQILQDLFAEHHFDAVYHCAAQLAHGVHLNKHLLWSSNVEGTRLLAEAAIHAGVRPFVFISSNCLWAHDLGHPVREDDVPAPVELYGRSKLAGEELLQQYAQQLDVVILRCPTIMDAGRLGLLAILFEFIDDAKTVWTVGDGGNRYQFIYGEDLAAACMLAARHGRSELFHIGSDDVKSMREVYEAVISQSRALNGRRKRSRVRALPKTATLAAMRLAHRLRLSPLGPYQYKMIAENFVFDTTAIKQRLGWRPTLTNEQMLVAAYDYYAENRREIASRKQVSAHRKPAPMGVIRLLKWIS